MSKIRSKGKTWCLRAWPSNFPERKLRFIHQALLYVRSQGFLGVPALATTGSGNTIVRLNDRLLDAQEWIGGEPLSGVKPTVEPLPNSVRPVSPKMLDALATAIARFHLASADFEHHKVGTSVLLRDLNTYKYQALERKDALGLAIETQTTGQEFRIASRWLTLLPRAMSIADKILDTHSSGLYSSLVLCHSDLWATHVYFAENTFVGFVDLEGLSSGPPTIDIAQAILHFNGWSSRDDILKSYEKTQPLSEKDKSILPAAAILELVSEGVWAIENLYGQASATSSVQRNAHKTNLHVLLESLEMIVAELEG